MWVEKMHRAAVLLPLVFLYACASLPERVERQIKYVMPKEEASPGEVFRLGFVLPKEIRNGYIRFLDRKFTIYRRQDFEKGTYMCFLPIPRVNPGKYRIHCVFLLAGERKTIQTELSLQILPDFRKHPVDTVASQGFEVKKYMEERMKIQALLSRPVFRARKLQDFMLPVGGEVVSTFGTVRKYGSKAEVALEGIEITPVSASVLDVNAAADGLVLLAEKLPMLGNTVLIDHGFSFATVYCHMKNLEVKTGQNLKRGALLGKIGMTGAAAKDKKLYYQLFVAGTPIDVQTFSKIEMFE
ncbi:M23 family metallopeptidase [candidate division FCPU426 bacterium]|nr:M23 family metallopeptidase [candidate division FCPU426 bacterium]